MIPKKPAPDLIRDGYRFFGKDHVPTLWPPIDRAEGSVRLSMEARCMAQTPYDSGLGKNPANFQPLTPLTFLSRAASVFPDHPAVIHGQRRWTYAELYARTRRLASALARRGIKRGDTVSVMMANTPAMVEAHYGVPMTRGVLNTLNTRLDAAIIAFSLDHAETKVL